MLSPQLLALFHGTALAFQLAALLYTIALIVTALIAVLARTPTRRRAALDVMRLLLRRHGK